MEQNYNRKQAMELLGIKSTNAFKHLAKKFPDSFVIVKKDSDNFARYDKAALDRFAKIRYSIKDQIR